MNQWQLQDAKARFSELVKCATTKGPQHITVRGEPTVVLISEAAFNELSKPKLSFIQFMRQSPLMGTKLNLTRDKSLNRDVDL